MGIFKIMKINNFSKILSLDIQSFRRLHDIQFDFANRINIICGQNGTAKSTILGLVAQNFNFDIEYQYNNEYDYELAKTNSKYADEHSKWITTKLEYECLSRGKDNSEPFISKFSEHFKLSETHDLPGSMHANTKIFDGYLQEEVEAKLDFPKYSDRTHRVVTRWKYKNDKNIGRKFTLPVIYLNLKRLLPIRERAEYSSVEKSFLLDNQREFIQLNNEILCRTYNANNISATTGDIDSAVTHADDYDYQSVSAGEDNIGQIILALFSFKKLQLEYPNYKGGLLLIDEIDAGLFPAAQKNLIEVLARYAKTLNLQIFATTHSPTVIETNLDLQNKDQDNNFKNFYLKVENKKVVLNNNLSWLEIQEDLHVQSILKEENHFEKIDIFFEDDEAKDFFRRIINDHYRKNFYSLNDAKLGCGNYINLINNNVRLFSHNSLIILDADVPPKKIQNLETILLLPGTLSPDQFLFSYLYNLKESDSYWKQTISRQQFLNLTAVKNVLSKLKHTDTEKIDFVNYLGQKHSDDLLRNVMKAFYKDKEIQQIFLNKAKLSPFTIGLTQKEKDNFSKLFSEKLLMAFASRNKISIENAKKIIKL